MSVKGNQAFLLDDMRAAFAQSKDIQSHTQPETGHGRIEKRSCRLIHGTDWIYKAGQWKGLKSLVEVTAERMGKPTGEKQNEVRYYISSLQAEPLSFNKYIRSHWGIGNGLHWTLDIGFREDKRLKRADHAAENFALITRMALNLLNTDKSIKASMKNKRHKAVWNNDYIIQLPTKTKI